MDLFFYLSRSIFPKIIDSIAKSQEALFLVSLAVAFGMAAFVSSPPVGFSVEIGGLLAGLALANSSSSYQIAARTRALRDFFIIIFFIFLGTEMVFFKYLTGYYSCFNSFCFCSCIKTLVYNDNNGIFRL